MLKNWCSYVNFMFVYMCVCLRNYPCLNPQKCFSSSPTSLNCIKSGNTLFLFCWLYFYILFFLLHSFTGRESLFVRLVRSTRFKTTVSIFFCRNHRVDFLTGFVAGLIWNVNICPSYRGRNLPGHLSGNKHWNIATGYYSNIFHKKRNNYNRLNCEQASLVCLSFNFMLPRFKKQCTFWRHFFLLFKYCFNLSLKLSSL